MSGRSPRDLERVAVFRNSERVGSLTRTAHGCRFEYDDAFFEQHRELPGGLATHLPYAERSLDTAGVNLPPYFAGLLPEGLRLRALVSRLKTSEDDLFSLLVATGSDCVGDLFVVPEGQAPTLDDETSAVTDDVSFAELWKAALDTDASPLLAGVQEKLSPSLISLPIRARGRRWILKLNPPDKPELVANEYFFMRLAAECLAQVAKVELHHDRDGVPGLFVARFDRVRDSATGRWLGVRQEDACQLLDLYPSEKYRVPLRDIFQALEGCGAPMVQRLRLIELIAFSYLIGNGDLHAKNVSVGQRGTSLQLTEAYDLLSTRPYGDWRLALSVEGRDDHLKRAHLVELGGRHGVPAKAVITRLDAICAKVKDAVPSVKEIGFDARRTRLLTETMTKRLGDLGDRR